MKVFFSNKFEVLADALREELFFTPGHPFTKRVVVVPSLSVKNELFYRWAKDPHLEVAAGVQVITLGQALQLFFTTIPCLLDLSLKIQSMLDLDGPVKAYLEGGGTKRLTGLCDQLSALFLKQMLFRGKPFKTDWLQELFERCVGEIRTVSFNSPLYLFNFSFLPQMFLEFFKENALAGFFISPTPLYWGDVASPAQQRVLFQKASKAEQEELKGYFGEQNQLLSNLGKMGRQFWLQLQEGEVEERYEEPESLSFQKQLFHLEPLNLDPSSVQIHAAPSPAREVEVVWEIIERLGLLPRDILVLAPDINDYTSYIHKVFQGKAYTISGIRGNLEHLEHFLKLPQLEYSVEAVLKLLCYPSFLEKFGFTSEERSLIEKWTEQANICLNGWELGFERMLKALASSPEEGDPLIELSQAESVGKWIEVVRLLKTELAPIEENVSKSLTDWIRYFNHLIPKFFQITSEEEGFLQALSKHSNATHGEFSFESMQRLIYGIFEKNTEVFQTGQLQAIRFGSLKGGAAVPAKAVILMGMEEGSYPRLDKRNPLGEVEGDYSPTLGEEDRYLFLELLLSTRQVFVMTYSHLDPEDGKEKRPSLLIEELFKTVPITFHPTLPFDAAYFQKNGFRSCSENYYKVAQNYYGKKKQTIQPLIKIPAALEKIPQHTVDLKHLKKLARHPVQFFFERKLGIYFEKRKRPDKEFVLSALDLSYFRRASLTLPLGEVIDKAARKGMLPTGAFRDVALHRIEEDVAEYHNTLKMVGITPNSIYSVEFKPSCPFPIEIRAGEWVCPPLQIPLQEGRVISLIGRLDNVSPEGLIFHGEDRLEDWMKAWPLYLAALNLPFKVAPHLLLTKKGIHKESFFLDPLEALGRYLTYYETALHNLSIFMPKWAKPLLKEGAVEPEQELDECLAWVLQRDRLEWVQEWVERWRPLLKEVFHEVL